MVSDTMVTLKSVTFESDHDEPVTIARAQYDELFAAAHEIFRIESDLCKRETDYASIRGRVYRRAYALRNAGVKPEND